MTQAHQAPSPLATVIRVTSGNFLEMFDFFLYGFYATYIASTFFPSGNEYVSLMATFVAFGAGFLMRPLGAVVLGGVIDRIGRRKGLILTLLIMSCGTILIAFVPGYATIGIFAPILVVLGRLLQGFSAGVELGGVSVYLAEMAPPGRKGFYVSWQSASQQAAIMAAAALGFALNRALSPAEVGEWGWRIPFFIGCMIIPIVFVIRRHLQETEEFKARKHRPAFREILHSIAANWRLVVLGMMLVVMTTVSFYLITVYAPTFGKSVLKLSAADSLLATFCIGLSNFIWLPVMGALSDRIGRWPLLVTFTVLPILTAHPVLSWLVNDTTFAHMLEAELWLSFMYASYNGATVVALTEIMPAHVRTVGFSLAYSLATAVFGGFTPVISTWLIQATGDKAAPGYWMAAAAACGLIAALALYRPWRGSRVEATAA
ncbi:MFS transporter [Massilia sp. YIM B02763]|uniref:MFS transporter n=1 Tax=Massilia sp. YIM B02763 TaxID=3050130 RepID=UPI0025B6BA25|nr:MFS transporter [Massilia sp. YIM B02763]MDN4054314.1 MFS transporter [Massilia sp. YIM B02763]